MTTETQTLLMPPDQAGRVVPSVSTEIWRTGTSAVKIRANSIIFGTGICHWTRIGNYVSATLSVAWTVPLTSTLPVNIGPLPFAYTAGTQPYATVYGDNLRTALASSEVWLAPAGPSGGTYLDLVQLVPQTGVTSLIIDTQFFNPGACHTSTFSYTTDEL